MTFEWIAVLILGFSVGLVSSILGLGGGVFIVPLLPLVVNLSQQEVLATSLFSVFFVVSFNTWRFHRRSLVDWRLAVLLGPTSAVGAFIAGQVSLSLSQSLLRLLLAAVLGFFGYQMLRPEKKRESEPSKTLHRSLPGLGVINGVLSGLTGIGSGIILNPLMLQNRLTLPVKVSPTANAIMIFTTGFGALAFAFSGESSGGWRWGEIHLDLALVLTFGAWSVSGFGRRFQQNLSERARKRILGWVLVVLCGRVLWSEFGDALSKLLSP